MTDSPHAGLDDLWCTDREYATRNDDITGRFILPAPQRGEHRALKIRADHRDPFPARNQASLPSHG